MCVCVCVCVCANTSRNDVFACFFSGSIDPTLGKVFLGMTDAEVSKGTGVALALEGETEARVGGHATWFRRVNVSNTLFHLLR